MHVQQCRKNCIWGKNECAAKTLNIVVKYGACCVMGDKLSVCNIHLSFICSFWNFTSRVPLLYTCDTGLLRPHFPLYTDTFDDIVMHCTLSQVCSPYSTSWSIPGRQAYDRATFYLSFSTCQSGSDIKVSKPYLELLSYYPPTHTHTPQSTHPPLTLCSVLVQWYGCRFGSTFEGHPLNTYTWTCEKITSFAAQHFLPGLCIIPWVHQQDLLCCVLV